MAAPLYTFAHVLHCATNYIKPICYAKIMEKDSDDLDSIDSQSRWSDLKKDIKEMRKAIDEMKNFAIDEVSRFDSPESGLVKWIDRLQPHRRAEFQSEVKYWDDENMRYFLGEIVDHVNDESDMLEFIKTETDGLCFFDHHKIHERVYLDNYKLPNQLVERAAHVLNRRIILNLGEQVNELVTA